MTAIQAKMEKYFKQHKFNWSDVWTSIHQTKISLDIKTAIYFQIHLGHFSEYGLVKRGTMYNTCTSATCMLCDEALSEHYHEILHCRVLFKVLNHFMPLILSFRSRDLSDEELVSAWYPCFIQI